MEIIKKEQVFNTKLTVKCWNNHFKYSTQTDQPGSFFVMTKTDNLPISESMVASYHHSLKDKFLVLQLSSYLDPMRVYQCFTPLSKNQHLELKKRCKGGVSVDEFDVVVESISDTPWTHVLLAGQKVEHNPKEGNDAAAHQTFHMFFQVCT